MTAFEFQPEHDGSLSLRAAVFQALGAASVCWDENGVFEDVLATQIGDKLVAFIEQYEA